MTKAVLVIGAGPSGMAQVNALVGAAGLDVRCFEMNSEIGGLWTWTDDVGDCHGSMYRYHQTNGLNEFLELEEYSFLEHFGHLITSYPPRAVMLDYLRGWTKKMGGDKCITLNRKVTSVTYDAETEKFTAVWKSTSELGSPEKHCVDLREPPRHRADVATGTMSRRWRGIATPSRRRSYGKHVASMAWGARNLISTQPRAPARRCGGSARAGARSGPRISS